MDLATISGYLTYLSTASICFGIVISSLFYRKLSPIFRSLLYYFILALVFDILCKTVGSYYKNNMVFISSYGFFELLFFTYLYSRHVFEKQSKIMFLVGIIGLIAVGYDCLTADYSDLINFQTYARTIADFSIVAFSMTYFFVKLSNGINLDNPKITLNTLILLYFSIHLIIFIPINYLINASTNFIYAFLIGNLILTILFYNALSITLWKNGKTPKHLRYGSE